MNETGNIFKERIGKFRPEKRQKLYTKHYKEDQKESVIKNPEKSGNTINITKKIHKKEFLVEIKYIKI